MFQQNPYWSCHSFLSIGQKCYSNPLSFLAKHLKHFMIFLHFFLAVILAIWSTAQISRTQVIVHHPQSSAHNTPCSWLRELLSSKKSQFFCSWVGSRFDHVHTISEPYQGLLTRSRPPLQTGWSCRFGPHPSSITVFTPTQMNRTKGANEPELDSTELNTAGVKTSYETNENERKWKNSQRYDCWIVGNTCVHVENAIAKLPHRECTNILSQIEMGRQHLAVSYELIWLFLLFVSTGCLCWL